MTIERNRPETRYRIEGIPGDFANLREAAAVYVTRFNQCVRAVPGPNAMGWEERPLTVSECLDTLAGILEARKRNTRPIVHNPHQRIG